MTRTRAVLALLALLAVALTGWLVLRSGGSENDFADFSRCPLSDPATDLCLYSRASSGSLTVGSRTVPLSRPIVFQGGVHVIEDSQREIVGDRFLGAAHGDPLSPTPEPFPGGLRAALDASLLPSGLRARLRRYLASEPGANELTATIQLGVPARRVTIDIQNLIERSGVALVLPVEVRLANPFLGSACYIGSAAHPIPLALYTGWTNPPPPNRPISGRIAHTSVKDEYSLTVIRESALVDNSFAAPAVHGCALQGTDAAPIDRALDAGLGLPAPAGENTAILDGALSDADASAVRAHRPSAGE